MTLLLTIGFLKFIHQVLYAVYLLQLKEYRHDRLREHLLRKHKHMHHALFYTGLGAPLSRNMLPHPTGKAVLITTLSLIIGILLMYLLGFAGIAIALLFSLGIVFLSLSVVSPFEHMLRQQTYENARAKIIDYKSRGLLVIGITGSYGKTSTKDFLAHILRSSLTVLSTKNSINTPLGVARTIVNELKPEHKVFIVEMGAYKIGEISELCDIALPDIGIITGISNQHLSLFGSQDNIIKGKSELFDKLKPGSDAYISTLSPHKHKSSNTDIHIIHYGERDLDDSMKKILDASQLPKELAHNVIPAILIAQKLGIADKNIKESLLTLAPSEKTMKILEGRGGASVIDDTHNASEMGVMTAISFLSSMPHKNKLLIMPCIIELGEASENTHRGIGTLIKDSDIEAIITTDDYYSYIAETAPKEKVRLITKPDVVCAYLRDRITKDWIVVLEGKVSPHIIDFLTGDGI